MGCCQDDDPLTVIEALTILLTLAIVGLASWKLFELIRGWIG